MKCDKLTLYHYKSLNLPIYVASEVDEAIAELKEKLHDVDNQWNEQCKEIAQLKAKLVVLQSFYDLHGNVDNYIDQLKAENDKLKARIADLEKLNHDLCERVTENDEIRLHWEEIEQTRAENESLKAKLESVQSTAYADNVDAGMRERRLRRALWLARAERAKEMAKGYNAVVEWCSHSRWIEVERKCLKKAEEYR